MTHAVESKFQKARRCNSRGEQAGVAFNRSKVERSANFLSGWSLFANPRHWLTVWVALLVGVVLIPNSNDLLASESTGESSTARGLLAEFAPQNLPSVEGANPESAGTQGASGGWLSVIFSGGPIGVIIVLLLATLSLCSVYLVIDQILTLRRSELIPSGLGEEARDLLQAGKSEEATELCQQKPSMLSFVLLHGIEELPFGWTSVEKSLEDALAEQSARLYRKAEYLSVIGNIAPMVGLLGTVLGMILAFQRVAESQGTASASDLAEGIYQALITTVGGLIVAIPSLGAFAIFRNRLDQLVAEAAYMAQHVFSPLRKRKSSSEKRQ